MITAASPLVDESRLKLDHARDLLDDLLLAGADTRIARRSIIELETRIARQISQLESSNADRDRQVDEDRCRFVDRLVAGIRDGIASRVAALAPPENISGER
jgi:hypothetical protein